MLIHTIEDRDTDGWDDAESPSTASNEVFSPAAEVKTTANLADVRDRLERRRWYLRARRGLDMVLAFVGLVVLAPLLLLIALVVRIESDGAAVYASERVGREGRLFRCWKFRTMHADASGRLQELIASDESFRAEWLKDQKVRNDPRITTVGRFLRRSSMDELLQLFNVLKGDMSLIGPRPIPPESCHLYGLLLPIALAIRPGMTGLWQVSGRNNTTYAERIAFDIEYVLESNLATDIWIALRTSRAVATSSGAF